MSSRVWEIVIALVAVIIAGIVLVFGDNLCERFVGHSCLPVANQPTQEPPPAQQPTPDLWQFYVDDIKKSVPSSAITTEDLKNIAAQIPASIPYFAEAEVGIIPYPYNGNIVNNESTVSLNTPEGGYSYISWGSGKIETNEIAVEYQWLDGNIYLVLVIGKSDDNTSEDLNTLLRLSAFSSGNVYTNFATPPGGQELGMSVINKAWFAQQLWWAQKNNMITISIVDLGSQSRLDYKVDPTSLQWNNN